MGTLFAFAQTRNGNYHLHTLILYCQRIEGKH